MRDRIFSLTKLEFMHFLELFGYTLFNIFESHTRKEPYETQSVS